MSVPGPAWRFAASTTASRVQTSSLLLPIHFVESRPKAFGELQCIVVRPEVHEQEPRLLVEHVAVQRGDLDAVVSQRLHHGVHFRSYQHIVAGDGRPAAPPWFAVD